MFNGELLAELRNDAELLQKELADILHVKRATITAYETGEIVPSLKVQIVIARYFDVSLDYLNGLTDVRASYNRDNYIIVPNTFSPEQKEEVMKFIRYLKSEHGAK